MATSLIERRDPTQFNLANYLIKQARESEEFFQRTGQKDESGAFPEIKKVIEGLTRQIPNRIYFAPDGRVCRVLFFSEDELPYQARIETLELGSNPRIIKSEGIVTATSADLEKEVSWWRRQFAMSGDLLLNPSLVIESLKNPGQFAHIGGSDVVFCHYYESTANGPKITNLGSGIHRRNGDFKVLAEPPSFIYEYAHPFATPNL